MADNNKLELVVEVDVNKAAALAEAHGVSAEASNRAVEAVKKVGFGA